MVHRPKRIPFLPHLRTSVKFATSISAGFFFDFFFVVSELLLSELDGTVDSFNSADVCVSIKKPKKRGKK